MKPLRLYQISISLVFITTLLTAYLPQPVLAHSPTGGSKIRISDEKVGPYILLVATSPLPVTVGQMDVWVRVRDGETDKLLRDAVVMIEATPQRGGPTLAAQATHEHAGNAFDYVAHLDIEDAGQWNFTVYVEDEPGQIDVAFTESVDRESNIILLIGLAVAFVVLATVVGVYLWRQSAAM